jgi:hypothetical protein
MTYYNKSQAEKLLAFYRPLIIHQQIEDLLIVKVNDLIIDQIGDDEYQLIAIAIDEYSECGDHLKK